MLRACLIWFIWVFKNTYIYTYTYWIYRNINKENFLQWKLLFISKFQKSYEHARTGEKEISCGIDSKRRFDKHTKLVSKFVVANRNVLFEIFFGITHLLSNDYLHYYYYFTWMSVYSGKAP